jgi:Lon protease-like protein
MSSAFVCPALGCTQGKHLFGPSLEKDHTMEALVSKDVIQNPNSDNALEFITSILRCSMCTNTLTDPVTTHCGHTFCKTCLLKDKLVVESCKKCLKRLPSYHFIQQQPINVTLSKFIRALLEFKNIAPMFSPMIDVSFNDPNHTNYNNVPIYLSNFNILPSQKLRIPITSQYARNVLHQCILTCSQYQTACFAMLHKDVANEDNAFGTIVKIKAIEQGKDSVLIHVTGLDRFKVDSILNQTDSYLQANINMVFEAREDLGMAGIQPNLHWSDFTAANIMSDSSVTKLAQRVYDFISGLSHSTPSISFCNAVEGLLGPVWLNSVQALNGPLPSPENPVAMCWWTGIVLPISDSDRYTLLKCATLNERLAIILSWIGDMESQRGAKPSPAINTITHVSQ